MLVALGVVSAANTPLWLRSFAEDDEPRRLYSLIYCALDAADERLAESKKVRATAAGKRELVLSGAQGEAFLGVLGPADEYLVFGYVSCTRTKFFFVLDEVCARRPRVCLCLHSHTHTRSCARRRCATPSSTCTPRTWTL